MRVWKVPSPLPRSRPAESLLKLGVIRSICPSPLKSPCNQGTGGVACPEVYLRSKRSIACPQEQAHSVIDRGGNRYVHLTVTVEIFGDDRACGAGHECIRCAERAVTVSEKNTDCCRSRNSGAIEGGNCQVNFSVAV